MSNMINIRVNQSPSQWNTDNDLLTGGESNQKIGKSDKFNGGTYTSMILHLSPARVSGYNMCPKASPGCKGICLNQAGIGSCNIDHKLINNPCHLARVGRTTLLKTDPKAFFQKLKKEINRFLVRCESTGSRPCLRLNGTSDLNWAKIKDPETNKNLMTLYPMIQFYDYTKCINYLNDLPKNYYLTFSRAEDNQLDVAKALSMGVNIAVVFDKKMGLPETYMGYPVFNGDQTDLRFIDNKLSGHKKPIVIGLIEKGYLAKHDRTGFVVRESDVMSQVA